MAEMTPEQQAQPALDVGVTSRGTPPDDGQADRDRLEQERAGEIPARDPQTDHAVTPRWAAAVLTLVSFPTGPGVVLVLVPWLITHFQEGAQPWPVAVRALGVALIAAGALVNVATFVWFPLEGSGVPWPTNPPSSRKVMVGGPYRYVRNPMYVSFFVAIIGEALLLSRPVLLIYLPVLVVLLVAFVRWYEEPTMAKRFGAAYDAYRKQVHAWWPVPRRRTP
jgi:protein-S-isoprenylcysteine O-methyltransferase Ste14